MSVVTAAVYGVLGSSYAARYAKYHGEALAQQALAARECGEVQFLGMAPGHSTQPTKCPGCGSHTYVLTRTGEVCGYCRIPRGNGPA